MFRELVKISKKVCFIGENSTFDTWYLQKDLELLRNSVHIVHRVGQLVYTIEYDRITIISEHDNHPTIDLIRQNHTNDSNFQCSDVSSNDIRTI